MSARRRLQAQLFGGVLLASEPSAESLELRWEAPAVCPDGDEARERVARFLGRAPGRAGDPRVSAHVHITESHGLFVAELDLESDDGSGQRRFEAERCEVVAEAAAYFVAAMVDPTVEPPGLDPALAPEREREPEPELAARPKLPPEREPTPARAELPTNPRRRVGGALRLGPAVGIGPLPTVAAGIVGGGALLLRRLRFEVLLAHWFARPARLDDRPEVGGDIRLTTGAARVCPLVVLRPIEVPVCGGFELGSMHGRGVGIGEPTEARLLWAAFSGGAGLIWMPSRRVGLWLDATFVVPVSRPVFVAENVGRVHQPAATAFCGALGLEARFF